MNVDVVKTKKQSAIELNTVTSSDEVNTTLKKEIVQIAATADLGIAADLDTIAGLETIAVLDMTTDSEVPAGTGTTILNLKRHDPEFVISRQESHHQED